MPHADAVAVAVAGTEASARNSARGGQKINCTHTIEHLATHTHTLAAIHWHVQQRPKQQRQSRQQRQ